MSDSLYMISRKANELTENMQLLATELQQVALAPASVDNSGIDPFIYALTIFSLACFVGYYVVWKVTPALHTPLMAVTNAISGVIIIGSMLAAGSNSWGAGSFFGLAAVFLAAINIFGGFVVTARMLEMFKKR